MSHPEDDQPIPGLASLRAPAAPPSLEAAVMKGIDDRIPGLASLRAPAAPPSLEAAVMKEIDDRIPAMASLREPAAPASLEAVVMRRIAQPAPESIWSWLRPPQHVERPIPGLASLRETTPPPSLVPAVMRRVAEPAPMTFWSWLRRPRRLELRLSPLSFAGMLGGVAMTVLLVFSMSARDRGHFVVEVPAPSATTAAVEQPTVVVRFHLMAQGARQVAVAGDFNDWDPNGTLLVNKDGQGNFVGTVRLPPGSHEYMFVVDGKWITDPAASELRDDGFGRTNAVLRL